MTATSAAPERLGRVARGSVLNLAGAAVSASSAFALTIVLTRGLSKADAGVFFSATALFLLLTNLGQLGTSTGLVYFLSRARALGTIGRVPRIIAIAMRPVIAVALLMAVGLFVFAGPIADAVGGDQAAEFASFLRVLALFIPLAAVGNLLLSGTRGLGTMRPTALLDLTIRTILQLVLVSVVVFGSLDSWVAWAWSLPYALLAVTAWIAWRSRWQRQSRRPDTGAGGEPNVTAGTFWRFTAPRAVSSVAQVAMQRFDIVLVGALAGVGQAAVYAAASRFLALGQLSGGAISQAVQPQLGEALAHQDRGSVGELYQTSTAWLVLLTWPMYLLFIVGGPVLLGIFGGGYDAGTSALTVLSLSMLVATGCGMVDMVLLMAGRSSWNLYNVLVAFSVNLAVDLALIPSLGILGAAIGWAAAILAANLLPLVQVGLSVKVHPFGKSALVAMGSAVACFGLLPMIVRLTMGSNWPALALSGVVGTLVYAGSLWTMRHTLRLGVLLRLRRQPRG